MLWIPVTVVAATFQVVRNAAQRGLVGGAGPWGATLTRFLFGFPFALLFAVVSWLAEGRPQGHFLDPEFLKFALTGSFTQVMATASLLVAMNRAGFAIGTALQQSSLPLAGVIGWLVYHDALSAHAWIGVGVVTVGVAALSWPRGPMTGERPVSGAVYGLLSGVLFGFSLNAFRHACLALAPKDLVFAATGTVAFTQFIQSIALGAWLLWRKPSAVMAVLQSWRGSLLAGFSGACASAAWQFALVLAPAASVRAVGVVESPIAAAAGRRLFAEKLSAWKLAAGGLVAIGVVMTALG